jgi:hypothetical protein
MTNKGQKKYLSIKYLALYIIGFLICFIKFKETGTYDSFEPGLFWVIIYCIIFIVMLIQNIIKTIKKIERFDFIPIIITLLVFVITWTSKFDFYKSKTVMIGYFSNTLARVDSKYRNPDCRSISFDFRLNKTCLVTFHETDCWKIKKYRYEINNDTVEFDNSIIEGSDSSLTNKYFIDKKSKTIFPISESKIKLIPIKIIK